MRRRRLLLARPRSVERPPPIGDVDPVAVRALGLVPPSEQWEPPPPGGDPELLRIIEEARARYEAAKPPPWAPPWHRDPPRPSAEQERAIGYLRRAEELLDHGKPEAALERMREAARLIRPAPPASGKVASGG